MPNESNDMDRVAMVFQRPDGRWEVVTSQTDGQDGFKRWRHRSIFQTEQEAEQHARSLLPYCDTAWSIPQQRAGSPDEEPKVLRTGKKSRRPPRKRRGNATTT